MNYYNRTEIDDKVQSAIDESKAHTNKSVALVAALSQPMNSFENGKRSLAMGVGHYKGESAVALKLGYKTEDDVVFNVGVATNSSDTVVNAGVSWSW